VVENFSVLSRSLRWKTKGGPVQRKVFTSFVNATFFFVRQTICSRFRPICCSRLKLFSEVVNLWLRGRPGWDPVAGIKHLTAQGKQASEWLEFEAFPPENFRSELSKETFNFFLPQTGGRKFSGNSSTFAFTGVHSSLG
jgi:hypothetical protein